MKPSKHNWHRQQIAKIMYRRGLSFYSHTDYEKAVEAFTKALEYGYFRPEQAQVNRGISHFENNDAQAALTDFEAVIQTSNQPTDQPSTFALAQAHHHRGLIRQQAGNEAGALADWSAAIAHCDTYPQPHYQRALVNLSQGLHEQALCDLNAAITADPTLTLAYLERGNLRHQLGDIPGAVADWEIAICNDFTLESAKQNLATVRQEAHDAQLSAILQPPLAEKGLSVVVNHSEDCLAIHIHRKLGTGVNYFTLPQLIQQHLVPLHIAGVNQFRLIGHLEEVNRPEWDKTYDLYKGQPCPPSNWQPAFSTLVMFPPLGIPAFVQAARVKKLYERGQYLEALSASKAVKGLCIAGSITLGFFVLLPLGYAAFDSMKETPTFSVAERPEESSKTPYQKIFED